MSAGEAGMSESDQFRVTNAIAEAYDFNPPKWCASARPERDVVRYAVMPKHSNIFDIVATDAPPLAMSKCVEVSWHWQSGTGPRDGWYGMSFTTEARCFWIYDDVVCVEVEPELLDLQKYLAWRNQQIDSVFGLVGVPEYASDHELRLYVRRCMERGFLRVHELANMLRNVMGLETK